MSDTWVKSMFPEDYKMDLPEKVSELSLRKEQPASTNAAAPRKTEPSVEKNSEDSTDEEDSKELSAAETSLLTKVLRARLVVTKTNVEVLRQDPNSPLYSVKSFDELNLEDLSSQQKFPSPNASVYQTPRDQLNIPE